MPNDMRTVDGYRELADVLNTAGATAAEADLRVAYHNHAFEFDPLNEDGANGYALLLEHLDPTLVTWRSTSTGRRSEARTRAPC